MSSKLKNNAVAVILGIMFAMLLLAWLTGEQG